MQDVEIRYAFVRKTDNLGINNQGFRKAGRFLDNPRIARRPVRPVLGVEPHSSIANVNLQPIAVMLQLVRQTRANRRRKDHGGRHG